jgi:ribose transport system permease protein
MLPSSSASGPVETTDAPNRAVLPRMGVSRRVAPFGLLIVLLLLTGVFSILSPDQFGTLANLRTTISSQSVLAILALAVLVPLIAGEFDVSLTMVFTTAMLVAAILVADHGWSLALAGAASLLVATLLGCVTGLLVVLTRASSLVVSLGMMILLRGASEALTEGRSIIVGGADGQMLRDLSTTVAYGTLPFMYLCAIAVVVWYITEMTPLGRRWHAVGGSAESARLLGLRPDQLKIGAFAAGGLLAGLAALLQLSASATATASLGSGFLFPAIASAFLGAVAFRIGTFNVRGTLTAIFVLAISITGISMLGAPNWVDGIFYGTALIVSVATVQFVWGRGT